MKITKSFVRIAMLPLAASIALASLAFADDSMDSKANTETKHDVSKNPITGNTTETTTTESSMKVGDSTKKMKHVHKKKMSKDGMKTKEENENTTEMHK